MGDGRREHGQGGHAVLWVPVCALGGLGVMLSLLITPPPGTGHSCPPGASAAACSYPGDQTTWSIGWTIGGLVLGLCLGLVTQAALVSRQAARAARAARDA